MKRAWPFLPLVSAAVVTVTVVAQSPPTDAETHMANARAAAGMEFRNTFINLCLPGGSRAGGGAPGAGRGGAESAAIGAPQGGPAGRGRGAATARLREYTEDRAA